MPKSSPLIEDYLKIYPDDRMHVFSKLCGYMRGYKEYGSQEEQAAADLFFAKAQKIIDLILDNQAEKMAAGYGQR